MEGEVQEYHPPHGVLNNSFACTHDPDPCAYMALIHKHAGPSSACMCAWPPSAHACTAPPAGMHTHLRRACRTLICVRGLHLHEQARPHPLARTRISAVHAGPSSACVAFICMSKRGPTRWHAHASPLSMQDPHLRAWPPSA